MDRTQSLKGILDLAVVAAIGRGESYGYEILQRLGDAGLDEVGDASVYGTLKRLEQQGVLRSRVVASTHGPARRYYGLTSSGAGWYRSARRTWRDLSVAVERLLEDE